MSLHALRCSWASLKALLECLWVWWSGLEVYGMGETHGISIVQRKLLPWFLILSHFSDTDFTKSFVESFLVYRGFSKKELDVKKSFGNGLGRSDGARREEVLAFLSEEKHRIGFLDEQDVSRSEAVWEVPSEVLEQPEQEEAEIDTWMQAEWKWAFVGSTGKSRLSCKGSSERPDFDSGWCSLSKLCRKGKRKRGQRRNKRRHEDSPDLEVPLTIDEEVLWGADEPPEKRSQEEETVGECMLLPLSLFVSFLSWILSCFDLMLSVF